MKALPFHEIEMVMPFNIKLHFRFNLMWPQFCKKTESVMLLLFEIFTDDSDQIEKLTQFAKHQFLNDEINQSTNFGKLLFSYKFTRFLQLLSFWVCFGLIERIERKFRTHNLSHTVNPNFTFTFSHIYLNICWFEKYIV